MFTTLADFDFRWCVLNKRDRGGRGAGARAFQYVRGNYKPLKETNLTVAARRHPFISPAWQCFFSRRFDVTCSMQPSSHVLYTTCEKLHNLFFYMDRKIE